MTDAASQRAVSIRTFNQHAHGLAPQAFAIHLNFARALVKAGRKDAPRKEPDAPDTKLPVQCEAAALLANL